MLGALGLFAQAPAEAHNFSTPSNVTVTGQDGALAVSWSTPGLGSTAFWGTNVQYRVKQPQGNWQQGGYVFAGNCNQNNPTGCSLTISSLTNNTTYEVRAGFRTGNNHDHYSSPVDGTPAAAQTNANLSALSASTHTSSTGTFTALTLTPSTFSATTTSYTASVGNARTHLKITPTVAATGATVKVGKQGTTLATVTSGQPSAAIELSVGSNAITVEVTASDTTTKKTYTVTVTRQQALAAGQVWAATLTVTGSAMIPGCDSATCDTQITPNTFTVGGQSNGLNLISVESGSLLVTLKNQKNVALQALKFCVGSTAFEIPDTTGPTMVWSNSGLTWSVGDIVSLSIGTSCPTQSTDATLSGLTATQATSASGPFTALSIGTFASATTSYTANVANSITHVKLTPTVNESNATVKVGKGSSLTAVTSGSASGAIALAVGANALKVEVTAQDGSTTQTYTVNVTRAQAQSTDATLSALSASSSTSASGSFTALSIGTFASGTTSYTVSVANSVTHVKLTPTVNESNATVKVGKGSSLTTVTSGSASAAIALTVGANAIKAVVTAQDGTTTQTYTVTVTRLAPPTQSNDAALSALTATSSTSASGSFTTLNIGTFAAGTTSYSASVGNSVTHVKLTPTVNNSNATVKVGKGSSLTTVASGTASGAIALAVGANAIKAVVTAQDGTTTQTYTVTVTRASQQTQSTDATLSGLTATSSTSASGSFTTLNIGAFAAGTTSYSASVGNSVTHVKLTPTVNHSNATVKVGKQGTTLATVPSGTASSAIALSVGSNTLVVRVTAQDTTTKDYTVTVTRAAAQGAVQSTNANLSALTAGSSTSSGGTFTNFSIGTFSASTTSYTASVANDQTHVKLTPTVADTGKATVGVRKGSSGNFASVTSGSASAAIALSVGANTLVVRVTAQDTTRIKDYTVTVTRRMAQAAPTGLTVTPGVMQLRVAWTAPSGSFTGYRLDITSATASAVANGAAASGSNPAAAWVAVATPANTSTSYTIDSNAVTLTHGKLYRVRLRTTAPDSAWVFSSGTPQAPATEDESAVLNLSLDGLARTLLSGAVGIIGERIAASDEPAPAIPEMDDADAWAAATGLLPSAAATSPKKDPWDPHAQNPDWMTGDISLNRSFAFSLDTPSGSQSQTDDSQWRVWGAGDLQNFRRRQTSSISRGGWNTVYLGLERRVAGHWLGGLALASGRGKADYSYSEGAAEGRLELRLKAAYPYFRTVTAEGFEIWAMAGAGQGRATNSINGQEPHSGRLHMRMAAAGLRLKMADWPSVQLSALADASAETLIIRGEQSLANLKSSVRRVRAGLELSGQGGEWSPYMRLNLRHEGGGGLSAAGLESEAGARYSHGRLGMDVRMRWMRLTGSRKYRESGAAATLRISPESDGTGLSLTLTPSRGRPDGTDLVWGASSLPSETPAGVDNGLAMTVKIGYGIRPLQLPGLVTPTLGYVRGAQGDERLRIGADYATELPYELRLGFGLERRETLGGADRNIRLDANMRW